MSNYGFTAAVKASFVFEGRQIDLVKGSTFATDDPCEMLRFIAALQNHLPASSNIGYRDSGGLTEQLQEECRLLGGSTGGASLVTPPAPPTNKNPSPPANDNPPTSTSPPSLDPPDPETNGTLEGGRRKSAEPDRRRAADQLHDRRDPRPDYEVAQNLGELGLTSVQIEEELQNARRNVAPRAEPHPEFSQNRRQSPDAISDPVLIASGEFQIEVTDVEIASRGFPLRFQRIYRSGRISFGPFGYNWDHNYNVYLRPTLDGSIAVWTGALTEHIYHGGPKRFEPPFSVFRLLELEAADALHPAQWVLSEPEGREFIFSVPIGWPDAYRVPLVQIRDRFGNAHDLTYDANGRLQRVADHAGRFLRFDYGDCELLEGLRDHTGRTWRYEHDDEIEHLVAVTGPATSDHPKGITIRYVYDTSASHPALIHNLTQVIDGNQELVVENVYGADPDNDDFNRVVQQEYAGYVSQFAATRLQYVPPGPDAINVPALRVEVIDPGYYFIYTFNNRGDLLDKRFRLGVDGSWRLVATTCRYDEQGNLIERYDADGRGLVYELDTTNPDPRARGNLLRILERASPLAPAPANVTFRATYEPRYWQLKTHRDAAGALTELIYDYEAAPAFKGHGAVIELRHPIITLPDGSTQQSTEHFIYNPAGQLIEHRENGTTHNFIYDTTGFVAGYLRQKTSAGAGVAIEERYEHDALGNLTARIDGVGNREEFDVNELGLPIEKRAADGATWRFKYDAANHLSTVLEPRGEYDDPILGGQPIRHELKYDVLGRLIHETKGANTATPRTSYWRRTADGDVMEWRDAVGRVALTVVDERGLAVREEVRAPDGSSVMVRNFHYGKVGQLERVAVEGGSAVLLRYDGFGRLFEVEGPDGTVLRQRRDVRGLVVESELIGRTGAPGSPIALLARRRFDLDELGQVRRATDVLFTSPGGPFTDVDTVFWRDGTGDARRIETPTGLILDRTFGPNGRLVSEQDSLGNAQTSKFDKAGRETGIDVTRNGASGQVTTSSSQDYDAVGRLIGERDSLGNIVQYRYDERGALVRMINPLGTVLERRGNAFDELVAQTLNGMTIVWDRDAAGRPQAFVDPTGATTRFVFDALNRVVQVIRPDGARQLHEYEPGGAVKTFEDFDGTRLEYTNDANGMPRRVHAIPASGVDATPDVNVEYDGLRRPVSADCGGVVHTRFYDSLNRLLRELGPDAISWSYDPAGRTQRITYPDGRRDRNELDELGRLRRSVLEATGTLPLSAQGFASGATLADYDWWDPHLIEAIRTASIETRLAYDPTARLTGVQHLANGLSFHREGYVRDGLGLLRGQRIASPVESGREFRHDLLTRLTEVRSGISPSTFPWVPASLSQPQLDAVANAAAVAPAATTIELTFTPGDTPKERIERDGSGAVLRTRVFSSNGLHQITDVDGVPVAHDAAGNVRSNDTRTFRYDAFRRLTEVADGGVTVARFRYDGFGRLHERAIGAGTERLAWSGDELLQVSVGAAPSVQYTASPLLDRPVLQHDAAASRVLAYDGVGSLVASCTLGGAVEERYTYDVFGYPRMLAPDGITPRGVSAIGLAPRFLGRPYLPEARLYDFRNRVYDPQLFVFLQPDPIPLTGSWNPYGFVRFNPVDYIDPYGEFWNLALGAAIGAGVGGIGTWLKGGDLQEIIAAAGGGAIGGALAFSGAPILGAALGGGLFGAWSGGRIGYQKGGGRGAAIGAVGGGVAGAVLGAAVGGLASGAGNLVATPIYGVLFNRALSAGLGGQMSANVARYGSMVAGGYAGGVAAGLFGNSASVIAIDLATSRPITLDQFRTPLLHSVAIDAPLNVVGAVANRFAMVRSFRGNWRNVLGFEGEALVGQKTGHRPANGRQRINVNGRERRPEFPTDDTLAEFDEVLEVKNKRKLSTADVRQIEDYAEHAAENGGGLRLYHRPGMDVSPVAGIGNLRPLPIPQQPLVIAVPAPIPQRRPRGEK